MSKIIERLLENARVLGEHDMPLSSHINRQAANHIIELESLLTAANERVKELEENTQRQAKTIGNFYDAIKNVGGDPCDFSKAIYKLGDENNQLTARAVRAESDAERYKTLKQHLYEHECIDIAEAYVRMKVIGCCPTGEEFDKAIDAARKEVEHGG